MSNVELPPILENSKNGKTPKKNTEKRRLSHNTELTSKENINSNQSYGSSGSSYGNSGYHRNSIISTEENRDGHRMKSWHPSEHSTKGNKIKLEPLLDTPRTGKASKLSVRDTNITTDSKTDLKSKKLDSLTRTKSEQNLFDKNKTNENLRDNFNNRTSLLGKRLLSIQNMENLTMNKKVGIENVNCLRRYSSTLTLNPQNEKSELYLRNYEVIQNDGDYIDEEEEKDIYIIEWLKQIDSEDREVPPEPEIEYEEEGTQKDTAIHIVYGEE